MEGNNKLEVALEVLNRAAINKELREAAEKVLREYLLEETLEQKQKASL